MGCAERFADLGGEGYDRLPHDIRDVLPSLSPGNFIRGCLTGKWTGAEAEQELRALSGFDLAGGGALVPGVLSDRVLDLARAKATFMQAGAITLPMESSTLAVARVTGDPTAAWYGELKTFTKSEPTFGLLNFDAKKCAVFVECPRELLEDASNAGSIIENSMVAALGLEIDRKAYFGMRPASNAGANAGGGPIEPEGLAVAAGVGEYKLATNGATIASVGNAYAPWSRAVELVETANHTPTVAVLHPRDVGTLDRRLDNEGQPLRPFASWERLRKFSTTAIHTDFPCGSGDGSVSFVGDFTGAAVGMRRTISLEVSRLGDGFQKYAVQLLVVARLDVGFLYPAAFARIIGILAES
jgi:HK97 family phage major capsid protein